MSIIPLNAPVLGAHVDWLSMSCDRATSVAALFDWKKERFAELSEAGYVAKPWGDHGYRGERIDDVIFGFNGTSLLVQLRSDEARRNWRSLAVQATNISRIDLATTIKPRADVGALARDGYEAARRFRPQRARPTGCSIVEDSKGGQTLYIGSRVSENYGRLYDKGKQSGEEAYSGCWRYEVEYKGKTALAKGRALLAAPRETEAVTGDVHRWFSARGVDPRFRAGSGSLDSAVPGRLADDEAWLSYCRKCVQPRNRKLRGRRTWLEAAEACCGRIDQVDELRAAIAALEHQLVQLEED